MSPPEPLEDDYRRLVESVLDYAIFMLDADGNVTSWNAGAERIKGYAAHEIIGAHFSRFYPPEDVEARKPQRSLEIAVREGHIEDEGWRVRKDGTRFWANVIITALFDDQGKLRGFGKVTRDVSSRRAAEEALRESEERFRLLVESVLDYAIFLLDAAGNVMSWNAGAERMKGYAAGEVIGTNFSRFFPEDAVRAGMPQQELERAMRDGRAEYEGWRVRKDGTLFWANVVLTALRDGHGRLVGYAKVTRDLTERRHAEEFRGRFVANAAHEIRTPLTTVKGVAEALLLRDSLKPDEVDGLIGALNRGVDRLTMLVRNLLDLTRLERASLEFTPRAVPVGRAIRDALDRAPVPAGKSLVVEGDTEARVFVDASRLGDVVTNLIVNAYRYGGPNVRIEITPNGSTTDIAVADDGDGVPDTGADRIFEPFYRGENTAGQTGSGLGLSIVRAVAEGMGGTVRYEPNEPSGARFVVSVPSGAPET